MFLLSWGCLWSVSLPHDAVGSSVICECVFPDHTHLVLRKIDNCEAVIRINLIPKDNKTITIVSLIRN